MLFDLFSKKKDPELSRPAKKILAWIDNRDLWKLKTNTLINEEHQLVLTYYRSETLIDYKGSYLNCCFNEYELRSIQESTKRLVDLIEKEISDREMQKVKAKFDELC